MTQKAEVDKLKTYALFQKGYTYKICMCNDPEPKTYLDKRMSPLHDIVMTLFDTVEEKHHRCSMYNLYNSATFFKVAYNHEKKY